MIDLNETAHKILDEAERYTQLNGFNAFSYKDLQREIGIKTSSIHYYFPTKLDLAEVMVTRYVERFEDFLSLLKQSHECPLERLESFVSAFADVVKQGKFCLCGMLASDFVTLDDRVAKAVDGFFSTAVNWIENTIEEGISLGVLSNRYASTDSANEFLCLTQGTMLVARVRRDTDYFEQVMTSYLNKIK